MSQQIIKEYPILYKIAKNGKIHMWQIKIIDISDDNDMSKIALVTYHGYKDGIFQESEKYEIDEGKQKRNLLEQAEQEANKKINDKKRLNYKEKIDDVSDITILPYLLQPFSKYSGKINYPAYIQEKLDGLRCLISVEKKKEKTVLVMKSRVGKEFPNPLSHIKKEIAENKLIKKLGFYLDGELYNHSLTINEINGTIHKQYFFDEDKKQTLDIQFYVFDFFDKNNPELTYEERYKILEKLIPEKLKYIKLLKNKIVKNEEKVYKITSEMMKNGYEGSIIRNFDFIYQPGRRVNNVLKIKAEIDEEFQVININNGKGKFKNCPIFTLITNDDEEFSATFSGTLEQCSQILKNKDKIIGKFVTVVFQEYTKTKIKDKIRRVPRHPRVKDIRLDLT